MITINPNLINEYFYCKNKLLLKNLITTNNNFVQIGSILDLDNKSKIRIGNFEIDDINHTTKTIIEIKKRITNFDGNKFQLLYYLHLTKNIFPNYTGKLIGLEDKKSFNLILSKKNEEDLLRILKNINEFILKNNFDYTLLIESKCIKCGCYDFCYA